MKRLTILFTLIITCQIAISQSRISKRIELDGAKKAALQFDEATVVQISGWDESFIFVEASISIYNNANNSAYRIEESSGSATVSVTGFIKDKKNLPQIIRIKKGDNIYAFNTDNWESPEIRKFYSENGKEGIEWTSTGISWDIELVVKVPKNLMLNVASKHGVIELTNIYGDVFARSTHRGIDVTFNDRMKTTLNARTKWGNIYSNLDLDIDKSQSSDKDWNHIVAGYNGGGGKQISLESKHANIYLRKE